ncbi:MAG: TrkH family potassium uptake protein, partial [Spirochaetales bacterium]|nr:TrkH family potassium uptake protein [Spirochaetales bacterium]
MCITSSSSELSPHCCLLSPSSWFFPLRSLFTSANSTLSLRFSYRWVSLAVSLLVFITCRNPVRRVATRDGFLLVTASWLAASLISALPFYLSGSIPKFTDALFETTSGYTTTGASILTAVEALPKSLLFWRSLTHWLGGMGIGAYRLIKAEAPGPTLDKITPKVARTAKYFWAIYLFFTIAETLLLMAGGMDLFDALTHTFGTLATGGFSPKVASVGHCNSTYIDVVITVFMIAAGLNFALYFWIITGNFKRIFSNVEMRVYLSIFAAATLIIALSLYRRAYADFPTSLRFAGFQAASILTTTGFVTTDYELWPALARAVLFALMFIGGCAGSTGGGIKVIRIIAMAKLAVNEMR